MPDLYAEISNIPEETQAMLGDALEIRAKEPQMQALRRRYFGWLEAPGGGHGIEIGCGTGDVSKDLLDSTALGSVHGIDPSPVLIGRARDRFGDIPGLSFDTDDARALNLPDESADVIVFHTVLCHIPDPDDALAEAFRVLRPGGQIAVFDGDYATNTASLGPNDPLQACMEHTAANLIHDIWLCRTLPARMRRAGFEIQRRDGHAYLAEGEAPYFQTLVNRGADFMARDGLISETGAAALKAETQRRIDAREFFGFIAFNSVIARKPA